MNRADWQYTSSCFRELLRKLGEEDFRVRVKYRFGLQYNPMFGFYHLWDGADERTVAIIKLRPKNVVIRYNPDFLMKKELLKLRLPDRKSIFILSDNICRHDSWARRIQPRCERRMRERADFLAQEQRSPYELAITIHRLAEMSIGAFGSDMPINSQIRVTFTSREELERDQNAAHRMIVTLCGYGWTFDQLPISFGELSELYIRLRTSHDRNMEYQAFRAMRYGNSVVGGSSTISGRALQALQSTGQSPSQMSNYAERRTTSNTRGLA